MIIPVDFKIDSIHSQEFTKMFMYSRIEKINSAKSWNLDVDIHDNASIKSAFSCSLVLNRIIGDFLYDVSVTKKLSRGILVDLIDKVEKLYQDFPTTGVGDTVSREIMFEKISDHLGVSHANISCLWKGWYDSID